MAGTNARRAAHAEEDTATRASRRWRGPEDTEPFGGDDEQSEPYRIPGWDHMGWLDRSLTWMMDRAPELLWLSGAAASATLGVALFASNPAGNGTQGDDYGPDAPLQPWVALMGGALLFVAGCCVVLAALAEDYRFLSFGDAMLLTRR